MALIGLGTEAAIYCPSKDDTGNGTGTLYDLSELHSNGTITGATWVADAGKGGVRALSFDGDNDLVSIGNIGFGSDPWSVGLWVKFTDFSDFAPLIVFTSATEDYQPGIYGNNQNDSTNTLGSWWESGDPDNGYDSTGTFVADTWYHVGVSYGSDGFLRYYIDGVAKGSTNWGTISAGNSTIYLGHQPTTLYGNLLLDDIRLYKATLTLGDFETLAISRGEGLVEDGGVLEVTEEDDTLDSTASAPVSGVLEVTEEDDDLTASELGFRTATLEVTEADDTLAAVGDNFVNHGSVNVTEADDTLLAAASSDRTATLEVTEEYDTLTAIGDNFVNHGSVETTEQADTLEAIASAPASGTLNVTEADDTLVSRGDQSAQDRGIFVRGMFVRSTRPNSMFLGV